MKTKLYLFMIAGILVISLNNCSKDDSDSPDVTDIDGNGYHSVVIGTQTWLKENLKVTKYNNGDLIGTTTPANLDISDEESPKYQWAYSGIESNVTAYGRLYTYYAITDSRGVCPTGWHVPDNAEWETLIDYAGGASVAGIKLKEKGTAHWYLASSSVTNETGFTALPGGLRLKEGTWMEINKYAVFWSNEEFSDPAANTVLLTSFSNGVNTSPDYKADGHSVRCIMDGE
jgi:uncharacterized protein (TIGR02145 family)